MEPRAPTTIWNKFPLASPTTNGVMVGIFGLGGKDSSGALTPFAQADEAASSIAAYQKFLKGDKLQE